MDEKANRKESVYELLKTDYPRQVIADKLHLSLSSVKRSIAEIYRELGVHDRKEFREKVK